MCSFLPVSKLTELMTQWEWICNTINRPSVTQKPEGFFYFTRRTEMTVFSNNPYDRRMERLMMTVPNFAPRGVGFRFTEAQLFITTTAATPTELLTATMRQIRCPPFRKRFNEYIESEEKTMTYINEKHRARFTLAVKNIAKANYALLSALYLLTADQRLWSCCKHHICPPFTANSITADNSVSSPARTPSASSPMRSLPRNRLTARTWTRTTAPSWECRRLPIGTRYSYTAAAGRYAASGSSRA